MYAIIKTGGKQFKVAPGDEIFVEKLDQADGVEFEIKEIVAINNDKEFVLDPDKLAKACVVAKVLKHGKSKKITVFTYKPKKDKRRKLGHRQPYTKIQIVSIKES